MNNKKLHNEVKKYLAFLQFEKKLSINTVNSYWHDLKLFSDYMVDGLGVKSFKSIKKQHVREYIKILNTYNVNDTIKEKKSSSISRSISSI